MQDGRFNVMAENGSEMIAEVGIDEDSQLDFVERSWRRGGMSNLRLEQFLA